MDVYFAPLARLGWPMFACVPLSFPLGLDAGTIHCPAGDACIAERGSADAAALEPRYGIATVRLFWRRLRVLKSGTGQSRPANFNRLSTRPITCRSGRRNSTFSAKHIWIAASMYIALLSWFAGGNRAPIHPGIEPDRKRSAPLQGSVIGSPVRGFVFQLYGLAHAIRVTS